MSLKYGKAELQTMEAALEGEYETVGEAAKAALLAAEEIFEKRAKFIVVGQVKDTKVRKDIDPSDPEAVKISLGWYSTEGDARTAAGSLWSSTASGDTLRTWVLPVFHGTAAEWHDKRKQQLVAAATKQKEADAERFQASIQKRMDEAEERNRGGKGACKCGHPRGEHRMAPQGYGECWFGGREIGTCTCPKFNEK